MLAKNITSNISSWPFLKNQREKARRDVNLLTNLLFKGILRSLRRQQEQMFNWQIIKGRFLAGSSKAAHP